jgi:hypothetical protein
MPEKEPTQQKPIDESFSLPRNAFVPRGILFRTNTGENSMNRNLANLHAPSPGPKQRNLPGGGSRFLSLIALLAVAALGSRLPAQTFTDFSVDFTNCSEFAGEGPISLAAAAPLVPSGFTINGAQSGTADIVIRATSCASATVDGRNARPTTLSQIGINIVPPDGTGDINNYTLVYISNNPFLVASFLAAGLPAQYDPDLTYEYSAASNANGNLYVAASTLGSARYFIYGPETAPPPNSATVFLANWWYAPHGELKMRQQSLFPAISFGTSSVTFYTASTSTLGRLVGGNTFSNFSVLALRGVYPSAHMEVTTSR